MLTALPVMLALSTTPLSAGILPVTLDKAWNWLGEPGPGQGLLLNLFAEGFGIVITIFVIERFINGLEERRQDQVWLPMKRQRCTHLLRSIDDLLREILVRGEHYEDETVDFPWEEDRGPYNSVRVVRRDFNSPSTRLTIQKKAQSDGIEFAVIRTSGTEIQKVIERDSSGRFLSPEIIVKLGKLCEEIEECSNVTYATEDEKINRLTHIAKTAFDEKRAIEAELFPRTKISLIRKAWYHSQFAITVLEGERIIAFQDPPRSRVTITQKQTIRANREGLREYWC